ncbi:plasmid mobilization protein, partial [Parafannyhessea umbonata]
MAGNRDLTLRVRCTPDELQEIDDIAQALGFDTRSDWVRAASL